MERSERKVERIFKEVMNLPESVDGRDLAAADTPGWDSSRHVELVLALESEFDIRFSAGEAVAMESLGDVRAAVRAKLDL